MRLSYRQLQVKVEELTEERSLQSSAATSASLLSEIEQSMEAEELEQEREQVLASPSLRQVRWPGAPGGIPWPWRAHQPSLSTLPAVSASA